MLPKNADKGNFYRFFAIPFVFFDKKTVKVRY